MLSCMLEQADSLSDKPHLDHFVLSWQIESVWSSDRPEYWAYNCNLEMQVSTDNGQVKAFAEWYNV